MKFRNLFVGMAIALALSTCAAWACAPAGFAIRDLSWDVSPPFASPIPSIKEYKVKISWTLANNCQAPAGAEVRFTILDQAGGLLGVWGEWPNGLNDIMPGAPYHFSTTYTTVAPVGSIKTKIIYTHQWGLDSTTTRLICDLLSSDMRKMVEERYSGTPWDNVILSYSKKIVKDEHIFESPLSAASPLKVAIDLARYAKGRADPETKTNTPKDIASDFLKDCRINGVDFYIRGLGAETGQ